MTTVTRKSKSVKAAAPAPAPCCCDREPVPCVACVDPVAAEVFVLNHALDLGAPITPAEARAEAEAMVPYCVCPQCRTCADAIAEHAEIWTGVPLDPAEASRRGAVMSGHEVEDGEDCGPAEDWPEGTWDNWFWTADDLPEPDDQAEAAQLFGATTTDYEVISRPDRAAVRRGIPSTGYAGGTSERFAFGHS